MAHMSLVSEDLRLVILGNTGVGKSATANTILGGEIFKEKETKECEIQRGTVDGRNVSVIDTPGINNTTLSADQLKTETKRCLLLSSPGPHVFLLVISVGEFTEEERNAVKWIQENFGEDALKFTMVLFIRREDMTSKQWTNFSQDTRMHELLDKCGFSYSVINSKREVNPAQITKLLKKIETTVQQNGGQHYSLEMYEDVPKWRALPEEGDEKREKKEREENERGSAHAEKRQEIQKEKYTEVLTELAITTSMGLPSKESNPEDLKRDQKMELSQNDEKVQAEANRPTRSVTMEGKPINEDYRRQESGNLKKWEEVGGATGGMIPDTGSDLRIVLLGTAGAGKSASGNTILGREVFGKNFTEGITMCNRQEGTVDDRIISVIDTRGISQRADILAYGKLFLECLSVSAPGPHAFLIVIHSPKALNNTIYPLFRYLGREFLQRALVLLTHGDKCGRDHRWVLNQNSELKQLVNSCGGAFQIFNNKEMDRTQVTQLLEKIDKLVQRNEGKHYTKEMFQEAERKRKETEIQKRVGNLERDVHVLSLQNQQISTVLLQSQRKSSKQVECCLL